MAFLSSLLPKMPFSSAASQWSEGDQLEQEGYFYALLILSEIVSIKNYIN